jgi:hypothetical protein
MNKYLSDKLRVLSFISMILVVFVHSYHLKLQLGEEVFRLDAGFNVFIQQFISQGIARVAISAIFILVDIGINCPLNFTSFSYIRELSIRR